MKTVEIEDNMVVAWSDSLPAHFSAETFILDEGEFVCKDCSDCKGSGLFKNIFDLYAVKCPKCLGKGVIKV